MISVSDEEAIILMKEMFDQKRRLTIYDIVGGLLEKKILTSTMYGVELASLFLARDCFFDLIEEVEPDVYEYFPPSPSNVF